MYEFLGVLLTTFIIPLAIAYSLLVAFLLASILLYIVKHHLK
jgi:hypothetical protein